MRYIYSNDVNGIISFNVTGVSGDDLFTRNYEIPAKAAREIRVITNEEPNSIGINTYLSENIPSDFFVLYPNGVHLYSNHQPEGCFVIDSTSFLSKPNEIIIDNTNDGFYIVDSTSRKKLSTLLTDKQKQYTLVCDPKDWIETITHNSYGHPVRSAVCKLAGSGKSEAIWETNLTRSGQYELYFYHQNVTVSYPDVSSVQPGSRLYYRIEHGGQEEKIVIEADNEADGWISLGKFKMDAGKVRVILNDKGGTIRNKSAQDVMDTKRQLIVADAIKWVYIGKIEETK